ncbi:M16 family metallopeptidase [Xylanibacter muris]|uniref:Insulinase family protein n=1 Tax=Xylanibacter muris TaxID=2736290 RepID=A0ABX2AP22_9BACT|nr:insulinase family protein [Xylanibacter muris]NPD92885.1 insulinase family protein [Xylanibacter muris]
MKLKSIVTACIVAATATTIQAKDYKYESVKGDMMQTRIYTLDNGLKVYMSVNNEKPRIQTYIAVRTGSRNDPAETTGLAHYLEHIMFKGTKKFGTSNYDAEAPYLKQIEELYEVYRKMTDPEERKACYHKIDSISQLAAKYNIPNEYDKLMSSIGASGTNAYTSNDVTCYTENIPSNEMENWAKIQSDRFQNMVIRGFHTELEAVYEEFNISLTKDSRKMWAAMFSKLYPNHPYGTQTTIGTQEHLKNPSIVNIKNYFNRYYVPNNTAICMAGDFDPDKAIAIIDKYFGSWKKSDNLSYPQYAPVPDRTTPTDTTVIGQEAENIVLGWKLDGAGTMQNDTLQLVASMLANGKAGLFDLDVNQKMTCQYASAFTYDLNEYTGFILYGTPNKGQTLDEVKRIMLDEVEKFKRGEFDENLLTSVVNNMKLDEYTSMESNDNRADKFVQAFINGVEWEKEVTKLDRISKMTKKELVDFANRHFRNNYVTVYKRTGEDHTQKKIDKPQITAIPANRDLQSSFVTEIINTKPEPIRPVFLDFDKDLDRYKSKKGIPVYYIRNKENGRFTLSYFFDFGEESDKWLPFAAQYFDYLGTDKLTPEQLKQKFYSLACNFSVNVGTGTMGISLSGLDENMPEAMRLMENVLANAKVDKEAWDKYVQTELKGRRDSKLSQNSNFRALMQYGMYGPYNSLRNVPDSVSLTNRNPQELIDMIAGLTKYEHDIRYYGPTDAKKLLAIINKEHKTPKKLLPKPENREYTEQLTEKNEIWLAPYKAKNINMIQFNNSGRRWNPEREPVASLFNEYFGGGMNTVVFQELRESRALAYSASAYYSTPSRKNHPEWSYTYIISQNDKMMDCINTFNSILDTVPQSEKAFELSKQALEKRIASRRVTKGAIFNAYFQARRLGLDYDINEKIYKALPEIKLADVVRFEQETMARQPRRYLILGDEENLDIKALEKIAPVRRIPTSEIFGY